MFNEVTLSGLIFPQMQFRKQQIFSFHVDLILWMINFSKLWIDYISWSQNIK